MTRYELYRQVRNRMFAAYDAIDWEMLNSKAVAALIPFKIEIMSASMFLNRLMEEEGLKLEDRHIPPVNDKDRDMWRVLVDKEGKWHDESKENS